MTLNEYEVTTTQATILFIAGSIRKAVEGVMRVERCPEHAIKGVRQVRVVSEAGNPL